MWSVSQSNEEQNVKEVNVLLFKNKEPQKMFTMDVPFQCNEFDIITTIFSDYRVLKDDLGYKLVGGNDETEHRLEVHSVNDRRRCYQYTVDVQPPLKPQKFHNPSNPLIDAQPPTRMPCSNLSIDFPPPREKPREFDNFGNLLNNEQFSDVTLSVSGRVIHAHKIILSNKSPVFEAMFTHEMSESRSSKVAIEDLDYNTVYDFLHYLYAGKLRDDYANDVFAKYSNLLVAADKYCVDRLKEKCEEKLLSVLTDENALDCLVLADSHNTVNLKKDAIDFIVGNADKIIELPAYRSFLLSHPDLSIEIMRVLVVEKNCKKSVVKKR